VGLSMALGNHELKNAILDFVITAATIKKSSSQHYECENKKVSDAIYDHGYA